MYIGDILVLSDTLEEHLEHVHSMLSLLQATGQVVRTDWCMLLLS